MEIYAMPARRNPGCGDLRDLAWRVAVLAAGRDRRRGAGRRPPVGSQAGGPRSGAGSPEVSDAIERRGTGWDMFFSDGSTCAPSPCVPNMLRISAGWLPVLPNQCGTRVVDLGRLAGAEDKVVVPREPDASGRRGRTATAYPSCDFGEGSLLLAGTLIFQACTPPGCGSGSRQAAPATASAAARPGPARQRWPLSCPPQPHSTPPFPEAATPVGMEAERRS